MLTPLKHKLRTIVIASIAGATIQSIALAQTTQTTEPIRLDPITVYVYKEKDDAQRLPVSVTGVSDSVLRGAGVLRISDAGILTVPLGNYSDWDARARVSGPISDKVGVRLTVGRGTRDGFTINDITGNDLDYRRTSYGKTQLWWTPTSEWEMRLIVTGQRDQDGDYGLNDLAALRQNPFRSSRDFEGIVERDVLSATGQIRWEGSRFTFGSTTGVVNWKTRDVTDLDYTARPLVVRDNKERDVQITQEARLASAPGAPARLGEGVRLRWQTGVFFFSQAYDQDAINNFAPFLLSPQLGIPVAQHSPRSGLNDIGAGVYGQVTTTFGENFDLTFGARVDHENKEADLLTFFDPAISPEARVTAEIGFTNVSPHVAASYRFAGNHMVYQCRPIRQFRIDECAVRG